MKKILLALTALTLCIGMLTGCDLLTPPDNGNKPSGPVVESPFKEIEQSYGKIGEAKQITQSVTIVSGKVTQYECNKTYEKGEGVYQVTGTSKRLNDITEDEPYTETVIDETVAAGAFEVSVKFDELYYSVWEVKDNTLTASVNDNSVKLALGIPGDLPAPVHNMQMKVETDGTHVGRIEIGYASGNSAVSIALAFVY